MTQVIKKTAMKKSVLMSFIESVKFVKASFLLKEAFANYCLSQASYFFSPPATNNFNVTVKIENLFTSHSIQVRPIRLDTTLNSVTLN